MSGQRQWPNPTKRGNGPRTKKKYRQLRARLDADRLLDAEEERTFIREWRAACRHNERTDQR